MEILRSFVFEPRISGSLYFHLGQPRNKKRIGQLCCRKENRDSGYLAIYLYLISKLNCLALIHIQTIFLAHRSWPKLRATFVQHINYKLVNFIYKKNEFVHRSQGILFLVCIGVCFAVLLQNSIVQFLVFVSPC